MQILLKVIHSLSSVRFQYRERKNMQKMTLVVVVKNGNMYINVHNMKKIFHFLLLYISEPVLPLPFI